MAFDIGDRVIYEVEDSDGKCLEGEIVDIAKNSEDKVTSYFAVTDRGLYVQFKPNNLRWFKLDEPSFIP
jgi:hypothetical protein